MFQNDVFEKLVQYLTSMRASFEKYVPEEQHTKMKLNSWIHNPFLPNLQKPEKSDQSDGSNLDQLTRRGSDLKICPRRKPHRRDSCAIFEHRSRPYCKGRRYLASVNDDQQRSVTLPP
ncbi:hypothetical protein EVAR_24859_1 [Eumeta japonica]|uniref:Uncharacterized protein n=1 Tax=Eumeta variegata TaxID=151549 RepID=A0A4C1Y7R2_EUMVA|nr:hypothetical protein EVAR_24859_1 [Eumeta japonica]